MTMPADELPDPDKEFLEKFEEQQQQDHPLISSDKMHNILTHLISALPNSPSSPYKGVFKVAGGFTITVEYKRTEQ